MAEEGIRKKFQRTPQGIQKAIDQLKDQRSKLDSGEITVSDFLKTNKSLFKQVTADIGIISGQGSAAASSVNPFLAELPSLGFQRTGGTASNPEIGTNLPEEFQSRVREELLPSNITGEERRQLLEEIPFDIPLESDRFEIERERIRQLNQSRRLLAKQTGLRGERLEDLGGILAGAEERAFGLNQPFIQEGLQEQGLLRSSGLGESLARERSRLSGITQEQLSIQALRDRDAEISGLGGILGQSQGFQNAALQRQFGLEDFQRQAQLAQFLGQQGQPRDDGGGGGFNFQTPLLATGLGAAIGGPAGAAGGFLGGSIFELGRGKG